MIGPLGTQADAWSGIEQEPPALGLFGREHRSTQRRILLGRDDEERLTADIVELARQYGRYGYSSYSLMLTHGSNSLM